MLYNIEKEQTTTTNNDRDESLKLNVEWKKPGTKEYIMYYSIYIKTIIKNISLYCWKS